MALIAYSENGGAIRQLMPFEDVHGNGGLLTSVGDLLKWNQRSLTEQQLERGKLNDGDATLRYAAARLDGCCTYKGPPRKHSGIAGMYRDCGIQRVAGPLSRSRPFGSGALQFQRGQRNPTGHAVADVFLGDAPPGTTRITGHRTGMYRSLRDHSVVQVAADSPEFSGSRYAHPERDGRRHVVRVGCALDTRARRPGVAGGRILERRSGSHACASRWSTAPW